jgi:uncharacterized membrane protein
MPVISQTITINAPVSKVFDYVTTPDNWTRYVTSLVDVTDLSDNTPQKGSTFSWVYKMMGLKFSGKGTVSDYEKDKSFGLMLEGKHTIKEAYEFVAKGDAASELKINVEYEMPGAVLSAIANSSIAEKLNSIEAQQVLDKIKTVCEA